MPETVVPFAARVQASICAAPTPALRPADGELFVCLQGAAGRGLYLHSRHRIARTRCATSVPLMNPEYPARPAGRRMTVVESIVLVLVIVALIPLAVPAFFLWIHGRP